MQPALEQILVSVRFESAAITAAEKERDDRVDLVRDLRARGKEGSDAEWELGRYDQFVRLVREAREREMWRGRVKALVTAEETMTEGERRKKEEEEAEERRKIEEAEAEEKRKRDEKEAEENLERDEQRRREEQEEREMEERLLAALRAEAAAEEEARATEERARREAEHREILEALQMPVAGEDNDQQNYGATGSDGQTGAESYQTALDSHNQAPANSHNHTAADSHNQAPTDSHTQTSSLNNAANLPANSNNAQDSQP